MYTSAIMGRIAYKRGVLSTWRGAEEEAPEAACQVVRYERGLLLVRVEDDADFLEVNLCVQLDVPLDDAALCQIDGKVKNLVSASDGMPIAFVAVDHCEVIQRRKQDRFGVNFPCRFAIVDEAGKAADEGEFTGAGKVTDISLGGIEFESEQALPVGTKLRMDVRPPNGRLDFVGSLVKSIDSFGGMHRYGVRIDSMDTVSSFILNRLVLRLERRVRRQRQIAATGLSTRPTVERRFWREPRRRWNR